MVRKVFEKLVNKIFFLISSMVLGLLGQLQIFSQLYLIKLLGLLTWLRLVAVDISKAFDRVWYADLLHKPRSYFRSDTFSTIN